MTYEKDEFGEPVDPEMRALRRHLGWLTGQYRSHHSPQHDEEFVREYHAVMERLYALGWDDELDFEDYLPYELMPEEYLRRNNMLDGSRFFY